MTRSKLNGVMKEKMMMLVSGRYGGYVGDRKGVRAARQLSGKREEAHGCVIEEQSDREELSVRDTRRGARFWEITTPCPTW